DTYIFSKGHGQDIVYEDSSSDYREHDIDTLIFKDVNYSEVKFRQEGNDLVLHGYHDNDSVTIKNFYKHIDHQFDRLEFADRGLTRDELRKEGIELFGTDGDDKFIDWGGKVTI
ncbi:calcium-binding protein, partial [Pasteurellaceae bacterium LIM206]|nr:calcium-binding protein [Pasteurellaceae bacterium LIM206]